MAGKGATKAFNTQAIKREDIEDTLEYVSELLDIPVTELHLLGSTGKMQVSGDIDIGIDSSKYSMDKIHPFLMGLLNNRGTINKGTKVGSYAIPIKGNPENGYVQVDLIPSPNIKWLSFAYSSPGSTSLYKGAVRNMLLMSVAATLNQPGLDVFVYDKATNQWIIRIGRAFDIGRGLKRVFKLRNRKKDGTFKVHMDTVTPEDIQREYPDIQFDGKTLVIDDPTEVVETMFGKGVTPADVESAEQIIMLIKTRFPEKMQQVIFKKARGKFEELQKRGINVPPI